MLPLVHVHTGAGAALIGPVKGDPGAAVSRQCPIPAVVIGADHHVIPAAGALGVHPGHHGSAIGAAGLADGQGGGEDIARAIEQGGLVDAPADASGRTGIPRTEGVALPAHVNRVLEALAARRVIQAQVHGSGGGQVEFLHLVGGEGPLVDDQLVHLATEGDGGVAVGPMAAIAQVEVDMRVVLSPTAAIALPIKDLHRHTGGTAAELIAGSAR